MSPRERIVALLRECGPMLPRVVRAKLITRDARALAAALAEMLAAGQLRVLKDGRIETVTR